MLKKLSIMIFVLLFVACQSLNVEDENSLIKNFEVKSNLGKLNLQWEFLKSRKIKTVELFKRESGFKKYVKIGSFKKTENECKIELPPLCEYELMLVIKDKKDRVLDKKILKSYVRLKRVILDKIGDYYIRIYLPKSYDEKDKRYPSLYLGDGHIVFDIEDDPANGWKIDTTVDRLIEKKEIEEIIMIGLVGNEGRFIDSETVVREIVPYVDSKYRTMSKREKRAILGSSAGADYAIWVLTTYPELFSMAGLLSYPSNYTIKNMGKIDGVKIWMDGGTNEPVYISDNRGKIKLLEEKGYIYGKEVLLYEDQGAYHMPQYWGERVENVLKYFYSENKSKEKSLRLEFNRVKEIGLKYYISPIVVMDNGMEYSVYNRAEYKINSKTASISKDGEVFFGEEKEIELEVKYGDFEEKINLRNPDENLTYDLFIYKERKRVKLSNIDFRELGESFYIEKESAKRISEELLYTWKDVFNYLNEGDKSYIKLRDFEKEILNSEYLFYLNVPEKNLIKKDRFSDIFLKVYSDVYYEGQTYILKDRAEFLEEVEKLCSFEITEYKDLMKLKNDLEFMGKLSEMLNRNSYFIMKTPIANNTYDLVSNYFFFEDEKIKLNRKTVVEFMGEKIYDSKEYKEYLNRKTDESYEKFRLYLKELVKKALYYNKYELKYEDGSLFKGGLSDLRKKLKNKKLFLMENMTIIGEM